MSYCNECGQFNCKVHAEAYICEYCKKSTRDKDRFIKHRDKCKSDYDKKVKLTEYFNELKQYYEAKLEDQKDITREKVQACLEYEKQIKELKFQHRALDEHVKTTSVTQILDESMKIQYTKELSTKNIEVAQVKQDLQRLKTEYHSSIQAHQARADKRITDMETTHRITMEKTLAEFNNRTICMEQEKKEQETLFNRKIADVISKMESARTQELHTIKAATDVKITEYTTQLKRAEKQRDEIQERYGNQISTVRAEYNHVQLQLTSTSQKLAQVTQTLEEQLKKLTAQYDQEKSAHYSNVNTLKSKVKALNETISRQEDEIKTCNERMKGLECVQDELNTVRTKAKQSHAHALTLQADLKAKETELLSQHKSQVDSFVQQINTLNYKCVNLEKVHKDYDKQLQYINVLRNELELVNGHSKQTSESNSGVIKENKALNQTIFQLTQKLENQKALYAQITIESEAIASQLQLQKETSAQLGKEIHTTQEQCKKAVQNVIDARNEDQTLIAKLRSNLKAEEENVSTIQQLKTDLHNKETQLSHFKALVKKAHLEIERVVKEQTKSERKQAEALSEITSLREQVKEFEKTIKQDRLDKEKLQLQLVQAEETIVRTQDYDTIKYNFKQLIAQHDQLRNVHSQTIQGIIELKADYEKKTLHSSQQYDELNSASKALSSELAEFKTKHDNHLELIQLLQAEKSDLTKIKVALEKEQDMILDATQHTLSKLKESQLRVKQLNAETVQLKGKTTQLNENMTRLKLTYEQEKLHQTNQYKLCLTKLASAKHTVNEHGLCFKQKETLQNELHLATSRNESLTETNLKLEECKQQLREDLSKAEQLVSAVQAEKAELFEINGQLMSEIAQLSFVKQALPQQAALLIQIERLKKQLIDTETERIEFKESSEQNIYAVDELTRLIKHNDELKVQHEQLQTKYDDYIKYVKQEYRKQEEVNQQLNQNLETLTVEYSEKCALETRYLKQIQIEKNEHSNRVHLLALKWEATEKELNNRITAATQTIKNLEEDSANKVADMKQTIKTIEQDKMVLRQTITTLEQNKTALKQTITTIENDDNNDKMKRINEFKGKLTQLNATHTDLEIRYDCLSQKYEAQSGQYEDLKKNHTKLVSENRKLKQIEQEYEKIAEWKTQLPALKTELEKSKQAWMSLNEQHINARDALKQIEQKYTTLSASYNELLPLESQLKLLKDLNTTLVKKVDRLKGEEEAHIKIRIQLDTITKVYNACQEQCTKLEAKWTESKLTISNMEQNLLRLESDNKNLQYQLDSLPSLVEISLQNEQREQLYIENSTLKHKLQKLNTQIKEVNTLKEIEKEQQAQLKERYLEVTKLNKAITSLKQESIEQGKLYTATCKELDLFKTQAADLVKQKQALTDEIGFLKQTPDMLNNKVKRLRDDSLATIHKYIHREKQIQQALEQSDGKIKELEYAIEILTVEMNQSKTDMETILTLKENLKVEQAVHLQVRDSRIRELEELLNTYMRKQMNI